MSARLLAVPASLLALAGCATTGEAGSDPMPEPAGQCDDSKVQPFIGRQASAAIGQELLTITGAKQLRWAPPRTAVTMDFRPDRLTVSYDDDMAITRITCG